MTSGNAPPPSDRLNGQAQLARAVDAIAHELNKLLGLVTEKGVSIRSNLPDGHPLRAEIEELLRTGARAAHLTDRLCGLTRGAISSQNVTDAVDVHALPHERSPDSESPNPGGTERILLVEDQDPLRRVLRRMLVHLGYDVLDAREPLEAIALVRSGPPPIDLLVTDVVMPNMSGRELAERLVAEGAICRVLFISGYPNDEILRREIRQGHAQLLAKPFTPRELALKIREVLAAPAIAPANQATAPEST